jgi:hypothetical protein
MEHGLPRFCSFGFEPLGSTRNEDRRNGVWLYVDRVFKRSRNAFDNNHLGSTQFPAFLED